MPGGGPRTSRARCSRPARAGRRGRFRGSRRMPSRARLAAEAARKKWKDSSWAVPQLVEVVFFAARLLRLLDGDAAQHALLVDDEGPALGVPRLTHEDAVFLRDVSLGVEIREQRGAQGFVALEGLEAPLVVHR